MSYGKLPIENREGFTPGFESIVRENEKRAAEMPKVGRVRLAEVKLHPQARYTKTALWCMSCNEDSFFYQIKGKDRHCPHCHVRWTNWEPAYEKKFKQRT